jgi:hypothetical protein
MLSSTIWQNNFRKRTPTFCIVKNIACNNKGDVRMLTIIVPMLSASLQKKLK